MIQEITGSIAGIINNVAGTYEGNLRHYLCNLFLRAANVTLPYHNMRHMLHVLWLCFRGGKFHIQELGPRRFRNLLIAALYHDFNHRGAPSNGNDAQNIENAVAAMRAALLPEDQLYADDIEALIRSTEYPHKEPSGQLSLEARILRDADCSQIFSPSWIQDFVFGLAVEKGWPVEDALKRQRQFVEGLQFASPWGKSEFGEAAKKEKVQEIDEFIDILAGASK